MSDERASAATHRGPWAAFRAAPADSPAKMLALVLAVCLVCSLVVSTTAVLLRPVHRANQEAARMRVLAETFSDLPGLGELIGDVDPAALETRVVDLRTGQWEPAIDPAAFDAEAAAADPERSVALDDEIDIAGLGRRENHAVVHLVRRDGRLRLLILPVRGEGYLSTMYGYVALSGDLETILGLAFYEHEETPDLGAQITDPRWQAKWRGKKVYDERGEIVVHVAEGAAAPGDPHAVDGISGATFTGDGVTALLRFWLGEHGFGPLLDRLRASGGTADSARRRPDSGTTWRQRA